MAEDEFEPSDHELAVVLWLSYSAYDAALEAGGTIGEAQAARDAVCDNYELACTMADLFDDNFIEFYLEEEFGRETLIVRRTKHFEETYGTDPDFWPTDDE